MENEISNKRVFEEFVKDYKSNKMSALVGAGFSKNVSNPKYLSWNGLLWDAYETIYEDEIEEYCQKQIGTILRTFSDSNEDEKKIRESLKKKYRNDYIDAHIKKENLLQLVSKYIAKKGYREAIDSYIELRTPYAVKDDDGIKLRYCNGNNEDEVVPEGMFSAHKSLLRCDKFLNIYTTNYDNLLEFTSENLSPNSRFNSTPIIEAMELSSSINKKNIIKIHGSLRKNAKDTNDEEDNAFVFDADHNIRYIISQEDYDTYLSKHEAFSYLMRIAMLSGTFCLIGFSGSDPNYRNWVHWMKDIICRDPHKQDKSHEQDTKVYLISVDKPENDKTPDDAYSEQSFNENHRVKILYLYDPEVLNAIMFKENALKVENGNEKEPSPKDVLTAFFDYLSRMSASNIFDVESESNNPNTNYALGILYYQGENKDFDKAIMHFEKAVKLDSKEAKAKLAECYFYYDSEDGEIKKEYFNKAVKLCEEGDVDVNSNLLFDVGSNYWSGINVPKNDEKAVEWWRMAAEQGHARAQRNLGVCYENGYGVSEDKSEAVIWYTKAAEQGNADAQCNLGYCYQNAIGVLKDKLEAVKLYTKAAEQGNVYAQYNLGFCYCNGIGVPEDKSKAEEWYKKAAEQGYADAYYELACIYQEQRRYEEALTNINEALKSSPNDAYYIDTLATIYKDLGRYAEAMEQFEKALNIAEEEKDEWNINEIKDHIRALKKLMSKDKE